MQAVRIHTTGSTDVLEFENVPQPAPAEHEVLIRVHAASVNPVDYKTRAGRFRAGKLDFPLILGRDVSGVIARVGGAVREWKDGDEVFAYLAAHSGGYAEYAVATAEEIAPKPGSLDHVHAAAVPLAALTAWQGLFDHGHLQAGQRVLIHGAGGGVGHLAVQFAKQARAEVIATAATEDVDLVRELGADQVIDYRVTPFQDRVDDIDLVLDLVAGETRDRSWAVLRAGGTLVSSLGEPARPSKAPAGTTGRGFMVRPDAAQLCHIGELIDQGQVRIRVTRTMPLASAREAHDQLETTHSQGKTVLAVT
jgi:NADPH:quinone reductase-like Zn-dependent oxidoreductase